jgi:3-keto-5-aminohexanoate cleavage enzyme
VRKSEHPNVPCQRHEAVADIVACARRGAAVVHLHARNEDESDAWTDDEYYRQVMDAVAEQCDVLIYPTYNHCDLSAVRRLDDTPGERVRLSMASFDIVQEVGFMVWDEPTTSFVSEVPGNLLELRRRHLNPTVAAFDVGHARWAGLAARAGLLTEPVNLKLFLCQSWAIGPRPRPEAIDAYLAELPEGLDVEPTLVPTAVGDGETVESLLHAALDRGVNIRVGLGDNPRAHPGATNADLVARAVELLGAHGFTPATPEDVRRRFGLRAATPHDSTGRGGTGSAPGQSGR